jgi:hypothetical protein
MTQSPTQMPTMNLSASSSLSALAATMTPAERAAGRFMRAPDHGEGGGEGSGEGAGADAAAAAAEAGKGANEGAAAAAAAEAAKPGEEVTKSGEGEAEAGKGAEGADAGKGNGDGGSIAGDAGAGKAGEGEEGKIEVLGAPEAYDVKVPAALAEQGMAFDKEVFDLVEPELRALNLSNDAAQALVAAYAEKVIPALQARSEKGATEQLEADSAKVRKEWADAARADPEIGGANFDKTVDACAQVWDKFGIKPGVGIRQLLNDSGIGNHPDMLRFLSRVASVTGEGRFVGGDGAGADTRPIWDRIYGQPEAASAGRT